MGNIYRTLIEYTCDECGKRFLAPSYRQRTKRQFCSQECARKKIGSEQRGSGNPMWKGNTKIRNGYAFIFTPEHPSAKYDGYVSEHHLIMEKYLGRFLDKSEVVHHKNGIKTDNRIENLEVMTNEEHTSLHHKGTKMSSEQKLKLSKAKKGKPMAKETKLKIKKTLERLHKEEPYRWNKTLSSTINNAY